MVTPHLPWKFHANRSSRFLVMLLTKKQRKKSPENKTPSPYRDRGNYGLLVHRRLYRAACDARAQPCMLFRCVKACMVFWCSIVHVDWQIWFTLWILAATREIVFNGLNRRKWGGAPIKSRYWQSIFFRSHIETWKVTYTCMALSWRRLLP